ncbi:primosomal protein N' [Aureibacillus halotolerans]|uniref:Replication restart protein PriA n=1 Tax=Aureibacillus halotolerans TaxID=1508390 RepID=A0A4R6U776_9BACI|nr:primosomal protein N' [Aureibacillus halotolerans]TDQ42368.1 replication restart DNA helicase PriA [Aureibacillus halotolerans]
MFASVVVDVPTQQTDRLYDYEVPESWEALVQPGMRVLVPFGPRKIQGMVLAIKASTDVLKTKPLIALLDLTPVLTEELLAIGKWLSNETMCFLITAYQAMLPSALKSTYSKKLVLADGRLPSDLPEELQVFYKNQRAVLWDDVESNLQTMKSVKLALEEGWIDVLYEAKDQTSIKHVKWVTLKQSLTEALASLAANAVRQREAIQLLASHKDGLALSVLSQRSNAGYSSLNKLVEKGIFHLEERELYREPYELMESTSTPLDLTEEQAAVLESIVSATDQSSATTFLLHGITGSGKTEVYLQAIDNALKQDKQAIVLVPEISLTPMMVDRFKKRFGSKVAVLHSALSKGERYDEWRKIHRKEVTVAVGARSAIFAPFDRLGIVIIDEEHETSYKQEEHPRYHARDVAIKRAAFHKCPVVLGSATPSLESRARAQKKRYHYVQLEKRIGKQSYPEVTIADMRDELKAGNRSMFSRQLMDALTETISRGEQAVLFLNRRGFSTFVMCRDCGYVLQCPHCDISLTYHKHHHAMKCHYCGHQEPLPRACPKCESEHIRFFGTGTQKVEEELLKLLPDIRILRMDVDTTKRKGSHAKLLDAFEAHEADVLLGTQMIAKGLDFRKVTFVGVLAAETMLHLPDFRAAEKTFQLLTQVSGRAGRHELPGQVVIQTYTPEHYSIMLSASHDYAGFYKQEMQFRKLSQYPPFYYLALVTITHEDLMECAKEAEKIARHLSQELSDEAILLGPVASPIPKIKDRFRYQCMIKYKDEPKLQPALKQIMALYAERIQKKELQVLIDMQPYSML